MKQYLITFFIMAIFSVDATQTTAINKRWQNMQNEYIQLQRNLNSNGYAKLEDLYCHPQWKIFKEKFQQLVLGPVNRNFVRVEVVGGTMTRTGYASYQAYEACYLQKCLSSKTYEKIKAFHETDFFNLPKECKQFNCTANTLGHLFYAAKILEQAQDKKLNTIVEFGGGYGNLAHIFKNILPEVTYFIIDLPELIALQHFFLSSVLPDVPVVIHSQVTHDYQKGAIHLIPSVLLADTTLDADAFISTFALTEAPRILQEIISNKKFFNAPLNYICGQLDGWGDVFENQAYLHHAMRECYNTVVCHPFHIELHSYEITGIN